MPRLINCSKAMRVLMMPSGGMPASVTPRCSGTSGRSSAKRRLTSITLGGSESLSDTQIAREAERIEQLAMLQGAGEHRRDRIVRLVNFSALAGSTEPQFTPTRMAQSFSPATSTRNLTLSCQGLLPLVMIESGPGCSAPCRRAGPRPSPADNSPANRPTGWPRLRWRISARASASLVLSTAMRTTSAPAATGR